MDSAEIEFVGNEEIPENSEYDALNDETFGNAEGTDDWEQEHEKFAIIEESFRKFTTTPLEDEIRVERTFQNEISVPSRAERLEIPQLKSLEEIEQELMKNSRKLSTPPPVTQQLNQLLYTSPQSKLLQHQHYPPPCQREVPAQPLNHITEPARVDPTQLLSLQYKENNAQANILQPSQQFVTLLPQVSQQEETIHSLHPSDKELGENEGYDPYAGLMNQRERRWLANIQVLQLEGDDPDYDFYFKEYQRRHGLHYRNSNNDKYNGLHNNDKGTYIPLQFENSLGKVQVGSVQAPRKVIDRELFTNGSQSSLEGDAKHKPRKKLKHILLELEYLYAALQRLDNQSSVKSQQRRPAQPPPLEVGTSSQLNEYPTDPAVLMGHFLKDRDHFLAYMSIRKGKVLGYRLLRLRQNDRFWLMLFQDFLLLVTRDQGEEILLTYLPLLRSWLQARGSWNVLSCILPALMEQSMDFALTNIFGMSVIASIIVTAECLYNANLPINKEQHELYVAFIMTLIEKASLHKSELQRPVMGIDMKTLESNFYRIESYFFRDHQRIDASKKAIVVNALALPTYQKKKNKIEH